MITKELIHNVVTFCNNYIDNNNIIINIGKYPNRLNVSFNIWTVSEIYINDLIGFIKGSIYNEKDFIEFKQQVLEKLPKLLEQLKEN